MQRDICLVLIFGFLNQCPNSLGEPVLMVRVMVIVLDLGNAIETQFDQK